MAKFESIGELKDKWRDRINTWLVDSAWISCDQDLERADAALEALYEHTHPKCEADKKIRDHAAAEERIKVEKHMEELAYAGGKRDPDEDEDEAGPESGLNPSLVVDGFEIAAKQDKGKPRYDLMPGDALDEVVKALSMGAEKYSVRNWEIGQPWGKVFGAMMRHCWAWWRGEELDKESGLHHMAHAGAEALFLLAYALRKVGTDDRTLNQIFHPPVSQTIKGPGRDFSLDPVGHEMKYEYYGGRCFTPCPHLQEAIMVGSSHCKKLCKYKGSVDSIKKFVICNFPKEVK